MPRSPWRTVLGATAVLAALTGLVGVPSSSLAVTAGHHHGSTHHTGKHAKGGNDPRRHRGLFVDPYMPAAKHARKQPVFKPIGTRAQPLWITDYYGTPAKARAATHDYSKRAVQAGKTPMMVIYAIPDRDCGGDSSGGMPTDAAYRSWVAAAAAGMKGTHPLVVLEPDAVPFIGDPSCSGLDARSREQDLTFAAMRLKAAGAWVYLDAGHSGWRTPAQIAALLKASGMRYARGFSTNVGNFRPTGQEQAYATQVKGALSRIGLKHKTNVIDTSRNGARTPPSMTDICNPTVARLGHVPQLQLKGTFDGYLWIKHPGESDGDSETSYRNCHGGPPSGAWFQAGALSLMGKH